MKSLLDQPAETWKSKEARSIEARYLAQKKALEEGETELRKKQALVLEPLKAKIKLIEQTTKELHPDALKILSDFLFGRLKYAVYLGYSPKIEEFKPESEIQTDSYYGNVKFEDLKLISLMGRTNGDLLWRIHRYSDGSGGSTEVYLVATLEEAKVKFVEYFKTSSRGYDKESLEEMKKWGIEPDSEMLAAYESRQIQSANVDVKEHEKKLKEAKRRLAEAERSDSEEDRR